MALSLSMRYITLSLVCLCASSVDSVDDKPPFWFSFEKFEKDGSFSSEIALRGDVGISGSIVNFFGKGRMMYKKPVSWIGTNPGFSTNFSFSGGGSLDFLLASDNSSRSARFLAVKFTTDFVVIDVGGQISAKSSNLYDLGLGLSGAQKWNSWIDHDGISKVIEVRVCKYGDLRPEKALVSCPVDLSNVLWKEAMYAGISSSSGGFNQTSSIYSWSFEIKNGVPFLMHSEPLDPEAISVRSDVGLEIHERRSSPWKIIVAWLVGAMFGAVVASVLFMLRSKFVKRHPVAPVGYPVLAMESGSEKIVVDGDKVVVVAAK